MTVKCQWCHQPKRLITTHNDVPMKDANLGMVCPWCDLLEVSARPKAGQYPEGKGKESP